MSDQKVHKAKLNPATIAQRVYDEVSKAIKVKLHATDISIELDHKDGDSVTSHPAKLVASVSGVSAEDNGKDIIPPIDCSSIRKIQVHVDGSGSVKVMVSPVDSGDYFVEQKENEVVARRIKVVSVDVVGSVHLVGRS